MKCHFILGSGHRSNADLLSDTVTKGLIYIILPLKDLRRTLLIIK